MSDDDDAVMRAVGPCFAGGEIFTFDPLTVPAVVVDPATGEPVPDTEAMPEGAVRLPLCPDCVDRISAARRKLGRPPVPQYPPGLLRPGWDDE